MWLDGNIVVNHGVTVDTQYVESLLLAVALQCRTCTSMCHRSYSTKVVDVCEKMAFLEEKMTYAEVGTLQLHCFGCVALVPRGTRLRGTFVTCVATCH